MGFHGGFHGKESTCNAGDLGSISGSGRFPGGGHGNPLQYSYLENPMDRGAWLQSMGSQRVRHDSATSRTHSGLVQNWPSLTLESFPFIITPWIPVLHCCGFVNSQALSAPWVSTRFGSSYQAFLLCHLASLWSSYGSVHNLDWNIKISHWITTKHTHLKSTSQWTITQFKNRKYPLDSTLRK